MFNIILMSKCSLFQLQIEYILSFLEKLVKLFYGSLWELEIETLPNHTVLGLRVCTKAQIGVLSLQGC